MNQRKLPRVDIRSISESNVLYRDRCAPGTRAIGPSLSLSLSASLESRFLAWMVAELKPGQCGGLLFLEFGREWDPFVPVLWRMARMITLFSMRIRSFDLGRRSRSRRHWFMKYPIQNSESLRCETFDWNAAAPYTGRTTPEQFTTRRGKGITV